MTKPDDILNPVIPMDPGTLKVLYSRISDETFFALQQTARQRGVSLDIVATEYFSADAKKRVNDKLDKYAEEEAREPGDPD